MYVSIINACDTDNDYVFTLLLLYLFKSLFFLLLLLTALILILFRPHKDILITGLSHQALIQYRISVLHHTYTPGQSMINYNKQLYRFSLLLRCNV